MKKHRLLKLATAAAVLLLGVSAVAGPASAATTLKVGATKTPHSIILNHVKPQLKKEGVNLKVTVFQDYSLIDKALVAKDLDATYFAHKPYVDQEVKKNGYKIAIVGAVHLEPISAYSKKVKKLSQLKDGSTILVSNNRPDYGRVLTILRDAGLITIKKGTKITDADFTDIAKNPKHLKFKHDYDPKLMPSLYKNNEGDVQFINANFAVQAGINPTKKAIATEKKSSPYANVVEVRKGDQNKPAVKKLMKALQSKSTQDWIAKRFNGAVLPVK
ncbi:MetQ/NlpA family ABC transporter substrate-binding protein [Loigolactobacillus iwatensis]|uniref:MetQ/NlpA family ABC transporter substrate-binding protein n=1 Tax=Loigolactobacillus iwatensis TaxID=1267156 RepID=UPI000F7D6319|nr:MetQ/NlpA family ABC transporter substrate-binding protein [Loigolactobacillus iwatensis]